MKRDYGNWKPIHAWRIKGLWIVSVIDFAFAYYIINIIYTYTHIHTQTHTDTETCPSQH
jgi:hypothetical protein